MKLLRAAAVALAITSANQAAWGQATTPAPPPTNVPGAAAPAEKNAQLALEKAGYTQITDVKSTAKGVSAKAMKNGKQVSVVVDSMGKIEEE
jgi:hypothetical protein